MGGPKGVAEQKQKREEYKEYRVKRGGTDAGVTSTRGGFKGDLKSRGGAARGGMYVKKGQLQ